MKVVHYEKHEHGHVMLQQGDEATSFYFIVSGSVVKSVSLPDPLGESPWPTSIELLDLLA